MARMLVLMNHVLNEQQMEDAKVSLNVSEVIYAPEQVAKVWSNIPASHSMWELRECLRPVFEWVESVVQPNDLVLVMGEAVATFLVVTDLREAYYPMKNVRCIATTTERVTEEVAQSDGSIQKKSVFRHVRYRAYYA
jgi:hypothetical protein